MNKTYIVIQGDTNKLPPTGDDIVIDTITLYNNNTVAYNFKQFDDSNNKIIKIEFDWDCNVDENISDTQLIKYLNDAEFVIDEYITYNKIEKYRGNMLEIINFEPNKFINSIITHHYNLDYNKNFNTKYYTRIYIYTANGKIYKKFIRIQFSSFDFFDIYGDIKLLNSQFIVNDYNYVFLTAEAKTNYIINYCLKQLANRKNSINSRIKIIKSKGIGDIVLISDENVYITTINGDPLYLITS